MMASPNKRTTFERFDSLVRRALAENDGVRPEQSSTGSIVSDDA